MILVLRLLTTGRGCSKMHIVKRLLLVFFIIVLAITAVLLTTCAYDCPTCKDDKKIDCEDCDSKGTVPCTNCDGSGTIPCYWCDGNGKVKLACNRCGASGYIYEFSSSFASFDIIKYDCSLCERGYILKDCPSYSSCGCQKGKRDCETCVGEGKVECPDCGEHK